MPHSILITFDCAFVRLLRAETQCAQNASDMGLAEPHSVHALNEHAHALDRPQLGAKAMCRWALQDRRAHLLELCLFQLRG